jgi:hypothetical protein
MVKDAKDAAVLFAKSWNKLDFTEWFENLAEDCQYSSQYVKEVLQNREAIVHYLSGKLETIKRTGHPVKARVATMVKGERPGPKKGSPCVGMYQGDCQSICSVVFFRVADGMVQYKLRCPEPYLVMLKTEESQDV